MLVRLQKFMAESGVASRRASEELILEGKVRVNNRVVTELGTKIDPHKDLVHVKNKVVKPAHKGIIILNKPKGVVTTKSDPEGRPTVADFLTKHFRSYFPVGRLDWDSTGLVLLTNDGELAEHLTHPKYEIERVYEIKVRGNPDDKDLEKIEKGIYLPDGKVAAKIKEFTPGDNNSWITLSITEGRNHIIKRMMEKIGHQVLKLKRISHGPFKLGSLGVGEVKRLTEREYQSFRNRILGE